MGSVASQESLFLLLPEKRPPWTQFGVSTGTQALVISLLLWARLLHPEILTPPEHNYRSVELVATPVPVNHQPQPVRVLPNPPAVAPVDPPTNALRLPAPQARPRVKLEEESAPAVVIAAKKPAPLLPDTTPTIPKQIVRTNTFSTGSSAAPTIARAASQVQTGGFGDPNGIAAKPNQDRAVNIAQAGSFDLPGGPGYGNGTAGAKGARGVVVSSGFGSSTAISDTHAPAARTVQRGGFGDADVAAAPTVRSQSAPAARVIPAEILSKPTPAYTEEARHLKIEGEVLLEVVLEASGQLRVVRVVRGLGHGLDDNAVKAAEQIHFKPAIRDGQPSDSTAVLHIIFQLA